MLSTDPDDGKWAGDMKAGRYSRAASRLISSN
jgi:hypothetical protein